MYRQHRSSEEKTRQGSVPVTSPSSRPVLPLPSTSLMLHYTLSTCRSRSPCHNFYVTHTHSLSFSLSLSVSPSLSLSPFLLHQCIRTAYPSLAYSLCFLFGRYLPYLSFSNLIANNVLYCIFCLYFLTVITRLLNSYFS